MDTKKYIIEIPDNTAWLQWVKVSDKDGHVCFDFKDPEDLTPYTEPDLDAVRNESYEKGVQDTKQHWEDAPWSGAYKLGYESGLNDAWETARKIASDNAGQNYSIFGQHFTAEILNTHSASEALEEIRAHEQAQKEKEEQEKAKEAIPHRNYQYLSDYWCECGWHLGKRGDVKFCANCGRRIKWD